MWRKVCFALLLAAFAALGCSPGSEPESVTAFDTVTSAFRKGTDFASAITFTVPDTVTHLTDSTGTDNITRVYDNLMLTRVRDNMRAIGWTEIPAPDATHKPDVAVQVAVTTSDYVVIEYWPPYWGYYPGWGYPGYGWGWGWGYTTAYSYTTGTVFLVMLDLRHPDTATQTVPTVWVGAANGVQSASAGSNQTRIVNGIDQAFKQSPYLYK